MLYLGELVYMLSWDESGGGKRNMGCFNLWHKRKKSATQDKKISCPEFGKSDTVLQKHGTYG